MKTPIFMVGLPRSGTTWIAKVLGATAGTSYFHEPFNDHNVPQSAPFTMRYLRASDNDPQFAAYCRKCFAGRQRHPSVKPHGQKWWQHIPGFTRVLIKDVHSALALDWISRHIAPRIVILMRSPLAVADSWLRVFGRDRDDGRISTRLLGQPALVADYLRPFESHIRSATDTPARAGVYWGACYHVLLSQQRAHPGWIVVRHEDFCDDPAGQFHQLCDRLGLRWTQRAEELLVQSNSEDSGHPYVPKRILANEKDKWRKTLTPEQQEAVVRAVRPFNVPGYDLKLLAAA